ncbi:PREDICTED: uncharacterized protein LOC108561987 [Nicrophorus vespilloides]|uniref:Uncharacterized protein LOC108561987 n=1 Tax=Nicrophorus vespilloides TaxID=110193 RepID=A0ABM1MM38_NICVS|nr:PREDICTED: uncharacterized protein LOC108561987 [Nicrophorus vespilloides]
MNDFAIEKFKQLGCRSKLQMSLAFQVHLELNEVKKYWDVEYKYNEQIDCLYLTACKCKNSDATTFIPIPACQKLNFNVMNKYLELSQSVCLVICKADSTCVYYEITVGIGVPPPDVPNTSASVQSKREQLDKELQKNRKVLEESALHGIPITLKSKDKPSDSDYSD